VLLREVMTKYPSMVRIALSGQSDHETLLKVAGLAHQYLSRHDDGELYLLTKSDGMIRKVVGAKANAASTIAATGAAAPSQAVTNQPAAARNPIPSTPGSIAAGKRVYDANCAACHGDRAQGAVKAGTPISIIEEQHGKQPPDLTDDQWDHGSSDGEIFAVIKRGLPPTMMAGFDGRLSDEDVWNIVNYLRSLHAQK